MIINLIFSILGLIDYLLEYIIITDREYRSDYITIYLKWNIEPEVIIEWRYRN
jgi:hypothetical protein